MDPIKGQLCSEIDCANDYGNEAEIGEALQEVYKTGV